MKVCDRKNKGMYGKHHSEKTKEKIRNSNYHKNLKGKINIGEKNGKWKGDKVQNDSIHKWIKTRKPKSMFCECCGEVTSKLDCANISGEYKRDISDFRWLCRRCHSKEHRGNIEWYNKIRGNKLRGEQN